MAKKVFDSNGYILVKKHSHPFRNHQNYVFEHRLKMEKKIGRYLKKDEVVHHINRIRGDNRLRNLKLFENNKVHLKNECLERYLSKFTKEFFVREYLKIRKSLRIISIENRLDKALIKKLLNFYEIKIRNRSEQNKIDWEKRKNERYKN